MAGIGALVARVFGGNDIYFIRVTFLVCSLLTVLFVYLLTVQLWKSPPGGVVAAVVFASFTGFAADALSGPDAKTPGIAAAVASMWLLSRRQWFWGAVAASLAVLVWQPLLMYPVVALAVPVLTGDGSQRMRRLGVAAAGVVAPVVVVAVYEAASGALGDAVEEGIIFPFTGRYVGHETVGQRIQRIESVVQHSYGGSGLLLVVGTVALIALAGWRLYQHRPRWRAGLLDPLLCVVLVTLLFNLLYACTDFQGYPDVFPMLPYGALGLGGAAAWVTAVIAGRVDTRLATAAVLLPAVALAAFCYARFHPDTVHQGNLATQLSSACAVQRLLSAGGGLYALGDPNPLVLTHHRNPDRYIYLNTGTDKWKVDHTAGGFTGWTDQITAANPAVITMGQWRSKLQLRMLAWLLQHGYTLSYAGKWHLLLPDRTRAVASSVGVELTDTPASFATDTSGQHLHGAGCP